MVRTLMEASDWLLYMLNMSLAAQNPPKVCTELAKLHQFTRQLHQEVEFKQNYDG